jgi:hypothetical protein
LGGLGGLAGGVRSHRGTAKRELTLGNWQRACYERRTCRVMNVQTS